MIIVVLILTIVNVVFIWYVVKYLYTIKTKIWGIQSDITIIQGKIYNLAVRFNIFENGVKPVDFIKESKDLITFTEEGCYERHS